MSFDDLDIRILDEKDEDVVLDFVVEHFVPNYVLSMAVDQSPEEGRSLFAPYVKNAIWQKVSYGAFIKGTRELIAIRVSLMGKNHHLCVYPSEISPLKNRQMAEFFALMLGKNPEEIVGTKDYLQFFFLGTRSDYKQRGIATELYNRSLILAEKEACKKVFTLASSAYVLQITDKLGFVREKTVRHSEYVDPITGNKIFECIKSPHLDSVRVVKTL